MAPIPKSPGTVAATANSVLNPSDLSPGLPASRFTNGTDDDVVLLVSSSRSITATAAFQAGNTDGKWITVTGSPWRSGTASGGTIYAWIRRVDGTETTPTIRWSGLTTGTSGDSCQAVIVPYSGVNVSGTNLANALAGTPTTANTASTTAITFPAMTLSVAEALRVVIAAKISDTAQSATSGMNSPYERVDSHTTTGTGQLLWIGDIAYASSGSSGTATIIPSSTTSSRTITVNIAFAPAAVTAANAARDFDAASSHSITLSGMTASVPTGAATGTLFSIIRRRDTVQYDHIWNAYNSGTNYIAASQAVDDGTGNPYNSWGGYGRWGPPHDTNGNDWYFIATSYNAGTSRHHIRVMSTGVNSHGNTGFADGTGNPTQVSDRMMIGWRAGGAAGSGQLPFDGRIALAGFVVGQQMSDSEFDAIDSLTDLLAWITTPANACVVPLTQTSTGTSVTDVTGGGSQSAITGTKVVADKVPNFDLTPPGGDVTSPVGRGAAAASGRNVLARELTDVAAGAAAAPGRAVTASVSTPVGRGVAAAGGRPVAATETTAVTRGPAAAGGRDVTAVVTAGSTIGRGQATAQGRDVTRAVSSVAVVARGQAVAQGRTVTAPEATPVARGAATAAGRNVLVRELAATGRGGATAAGRQIATARTEPVTRGSATAAGRQVTASNSTPVARGTSTAAGRAVAATEATQLQRGEALAQGRPVTAAGNVTEPVTRGSATAAGRVVLTRAITTVTRGQATAGGRVVQAREATVLARGRADAQGRVVTASSTSTAVIGRGHATAAGKPVLGVSGTIAIIGRGAATATGRAVTSRWSSIGTVLRGEAVAAGKPVTVAWSAVGVLTRGEATARGRPVVAYVVGPVVAVGVLEGTGSASSNDGAITARGPAGAGGRTRALESAGTATTIE